MRRQLPRRFWLESVLATLSGALFLVTLVWHDWIETIFGVDPDKSSGALEWTIVAALLAITVACGLLARREWVHSAATV